MGWPLASSPARLRSSRAMPKPRGSTAGRGLPGSSFAECGTNRRWVFCVAMPLDGCLLGMPAELLPALAAASPPSPMVSRWSFSGEDGGAAGTGIGGASSSPASGGAAVATAPIVRSLRTRRRNGTRTAFSGREAFRSTSSSLSSMAPHLGSSGMVRVRPYLRRDVGNSSSSSRSLSCTACACCLAAIWTASLRAALEVRRATCAKHSPLLLGPNV
mmetsp:Transcript_124778/g.347442  ORF Transcript_124778/g.347442 Transcript_124778/m.347442 type:complete len:216 (-) Transcript_124778:543-1190(-)